MNRRLLAVVGILTLFSVAGCKESKAPDAAPVPPPTAQKAKAPQAPAKAEAKADASTPSVPGKSSPDCVGPLEKGTPSTLEIAGHSYELNGYALTLKDAEKAKGPAKIGVLASVNEASAANLFNIERYLAFFKKGGAQLIVVAGDIGEDRANIEGVLDAIAESGLPVLAIAGNREKTSDFTAALAAAGKAHPNVLNGNRVRYVDFAGVDIITLPGYHDPRYIHPGGEGCQYFSQDVAALGKLASAANDPVLLLAHGQPLGKTENALDVIAPGKEHIGDSNLNAVIASAKIPFGIFPNVKEAGGTAIADLDGTKKVAAGTPSETLYLNPGSADSIAWTMNDGSTTTGAAALLTIQDGKASYELYEAPKLTDAEKLQAAKLVAPSAPSAKAE